MARFLYLLSCGALVGGQLFFAAIAAQVVFPREVSALPRDDPRRQLAADLVGAMLARLDAATIAGSAVAVVCAIVLGRRWAALAPLLAGLCAVISAALVTPAIHAMREAGATGSKRFGLLHGASTLLLVLEIALLVCALWQAARFRGIENALQAS
jgi:hypothetical protein